MANQTDLRVRISADLADIKQGLGLLRGELAKVKSQANASFSGSGNALSNGIKNAHRELKAFAVTYVSLAGAKMLAGIADEATQLRGRIRAAKGDYQAILAIANETRTGLALTADLYTRIERNSRGQIKNQQQLLTVTTAVNQAIKLSYASTQSGEAAVQQLGQALGSGILGGDELKSIRENAPRLAQAIADGLGVSIGKLKELGKEGKLTTKVVLDALTSQAKELETEYARVPVTIGDAFTQIRNSFVDYVGKADSASGASQRFATALQSVAGNLPQILDPLLQATTALIQNLDVLAVYIGSRIALAALPAMATGIRTVIGLITAARAATLTWSVALTALGGPVGIALAALAAALYLVWKRTNEAKVAAEEHSKALADNTALFKTDAAAALENARARRVQASETLTAARAELALAKARFATENTSATARGGDRGDAAALSSTNVLNRTRDAAAQAQKQYDEIGAQLAQFAVELAIPLDTVAEKTTATATAAAAAGKKIAASNALVQDSVKRALAELDRLYKVGDLGSKQYFASLTTLQQQAVDLQIEQARNELAVTKDLGQRKKIEEQITILQRDRAEIGVKNAQDEQLAIDAMIDKLGDVKAQLAELDGDTGKAARIRIYAQYHDLFKQLEADSDTTGKAMVQNLVDRLINKAKADEIASRVSTVSGSLSSGEQAISAQVGAGTLGYTEGERQLQELRQKSLEQLIQLRVAQAAYLATLSPASADFVAAQSGLNDLDTRIANVSASLHEFRNQATDQAVSSLGNFFGDLATSAKTFKEAFRDLVLSFIQGLARMAAEALAKKIILSFISGFGGGGAAVAPSAKGNVFGSGGLQAFAKGAAFALPGLMAFANGGAFTNQVFSNPTMFRFGQGGHFGVMGEAGPEAVMPLTRGSDGKLGVQAQGSGGAGLVTTPIVAFGDDAIAQALAGAAGERVVLTHVRNNKEALGLG